MPTPYEMRDWKQVAIKYDQLVYDLTNTNPYFPLVGIKSSGINYPSLKPIYLQTYVGSSSTQAEAINIIPSIVGASLVGIDKSNQSGVNWVEKVKDFFNKNNGQNVYLNNYSATSGGDWWYDTMPNIYFYQLYSQYPLLPDFNTQFVTIADRWLEAVQKMGGTTTPWAVPNMNYRGWYLSSMTGNAAGVKEPESAGAIGWILYHAYLKTQDKKYLNGAQMALEYLSNLNSNPSYELQLPYGTFIAAKMNAEQGTNYNIDKMLNWSFDRGPLRGWGTIKGQWDGKDISGLVGEANDGGNDYAFFLNGIQQAAALVPMVKYDKRYAKAIAKWTLNLASASRYFYSKYLPADRQDDYAWSTANDPESVIAYEALKEKNNFAGNLPLFGTGDAKRGNWAPTNLGLYGSSSVGYLGAILETTNVAGILKLDVNKTDFFGKNPFPTFLLYNPLSSNQQVTLQLGTNSYDIYDAISETNMATGVTGSTSVQIKAGEVVLLSYLPAGSTTTSTNGKLSIGNDIVDYHYGYDFTAKLKIKSLASTANAVAFNKQTTIYTQVDNASPALSYQWYVNNVLTQTTSVNTFNWTAPATAGDYTITLKAIDGAVSAKDSLTLKVAQTVPVITSISQDKKFYPVFSDVKLICNVPTAKEEKLTYTWTVPTGQAVTKDSLLNWVTPANEGFYTIHCTVTNSANLQSTFSVKLLVKKQSGTSQALAYYPLDGDVNDYSGHYNGQLRGAQPTVDARGSDGAAYLFTSGDNIIFIPNESNLNFQGAITLSFWVNPTKVTDESFILSHGSWEERWKVSLTPTRLLRWTVNTSVGTIDLDSTFPLDLNKFYHFTVTYTGFSMEIYADGVMDTYTAHTGLINTTSKALTFGRKDQEQTNYSLFGTIDEVRIYDKSLSLTEIANLKNLWNSEIVTGLESALNKNIIVYPNPSSGGSFYMQADNGTNTIMELIDTTGKKIPFTSLQEDTHFRITIDPGYKGLFLLRVKTQQGVAVKKVVLY